jgi:hypothetical protein
VGRKTTLGTAGGFGSGVTRFVAAKVTPKNAFGMWNRRRTLSSAMDDGESVTRPRAPARNFVNGRMPSKSSERLVFHFFGSILAIHSAA